MKMSFSRDDVKFLMQVASQVAIAVENALAFSKIAELKEKLTQEKLYLEDEIRTELNFEEIVGKSAVLRRVLKQVAHRGADGFNGFDLWRDGNGEGISRPGDPQFEFAPIKLVRETELCRPFPRGCWRANSSATKEGHLPAPLPSASADSSWPIAERYSSMKSEKIPLELQPKLLRVLQEREFERLGSSRTLTTDARLIAATNRDLASMVEEQKFRSDLFYRLNVFPVRVPPLRERPEDIPLLVRHFTEQCARRMNKKIETISTETLKQMRQYHWPGNIRELQNVIERAVILSAGPVLNVPLSEFQSRPALAAVDGNGKPERKGSNSPQAMIFGMFWKKPSGNTF